MKEKPWISGPNEILQHAYNLMQVDNDTNRRLAFLSIDNAVEIIIKTYLGLPNRITNIGLSKNKFDEVKENFTALLTTLEQYSADRLSEIDLGEIEWYHRVRNQLYHQGNGITVDRKKVDDYALLAKNLFEKLLNHTFSPKQAKEYNLLIEFMRAWAFIERMGTMIIVIRCGEGNVFPLDELPYQISWMGEFIDEIDIHKFEEFEKIWMEIINGDKDFRTVLSGEIIDQMRKFGKEIHDKYIYIEE